MFWFIQKILIGLLTSIVVNPSNHTKCVSLSNQCEIEPTLRAHLHEARSELKPV